MRSDSTDPVSLAQDSDFPSGEWVGFYRESGTRVRQELHLTFNAGRMSGTGADPNGSFLIRGTYDSESKEVTWTKVYPGSHAVHYKGYREIKGIWGLWEIPPVASDGFHIWPRVRGEGLDETLNAERDTPVEVTVGAP